MQPRNLNAQLAPVAGLGQRHVADMIFDVEIGILNPIGVIKVEGYAHQFLAKAARLVQAAFDVTKDILEPDKSAGRG